MDNTDVIGGFDIRLEWTPTEGELDYKYDDSIRTALRFSQPSRNSFGPELKASKGPIEVLVIDHIDTRSEN